MLKLGLKGDIPSPQFEILKRVVEQEYKVHLITGDDVAAAIQASAMFDGALPPETFVLPGHGRVGTLRCADDRGFLYGVLEIAESLGAGGPDIFDVSAQSGSSVNSGIDRPLPFRAVKFDLPWSAYRPGTALSDHYDTCRDRGFWTDFLDMMLVNRFNVLSLWNLHPFPFMIRTKKYPEACPLGDKALEEWQSFWRFLFREAKLRGIDTYMVFWNIHVSYAFQEARGLPRYEGQYHFGPGHKSELVKNYTREHVRDLIDAYPDLTGLGISLGERMQGMSVHEQAAWAEEAVFPGIKAAGRRIKFIYRAAFAQDPTPVRRSMEKLDFLDDIFVEYKFNWSHGHSTPEMRSTHDTRQDRAGAQQIKDAYWNPVPENYKICWTIRNEDFFILRWGNADFIREHIRKNSSDYTAGYFIGSEGMIPAKDIYRDPDDSERNWDYIFQRQWLFWHLWGRLLYNPETSDQALERAFARRYGGAAAPLLYEAWNSASRMLLDLACFFGSTWDYTLYAECFLSPCGKGYEVGTSMNGDDGYSPFISLERMMGQKTMAPEYISLIEWEGMIPPRKAEEGRISPVALAESQRINSAALDAALIELAALVEPMGNAPSPGLASELRDLKIWRELTLYFACKLEGGVALIEDNRDEAVAVLEEGLGHWDGIVALAEGRTVPVAYAQHYEDVFIADWKRYRGDAEKDILWARNDD